MPVLLSSLPSAAGPGFGPLPSRRTPEEQLDAWNQAWRASPLYQDTLAAWGLTPGRTLTLSRSQQARLEDLLASSGFGLPGGMHIDQAGNLNQKNRLLRNVGIGAAVVGGTLATLGAGGVGPLSSIFGGSAGSAAGAAGSGTAAGFYQSPGIYSGLFGATAPAMTATAPPLAAGWASKLGSIFGSPGVSTLANVGLGLYGMRAQLTANDRARLDTLDAQRQQIELEKARLAEAARNADLDREDARRLNEAMNALRQRELDLQDEQIKFDRELKLREEARYERRQSNLEPYRQASRAALDRLASIWGLPLGG